MRFFFVFIQRAAPVLEVEKESKALTKKEEDKDDKFGYLFGERVSYENDDDDKLLYYLNERISYEDYKDFNI